MTKLFSITFLFLLMPSTLFALGTNPAMAPIISYLLADTESVSKSREMPLIIIRIEFNDYQFSTSAANWSNKIFGTQEYQLNHYFNEISYGHFQFKKAVETDGNADGIITIFINEDHPGDVTEFIQRIKTASINADPYINYAQYDNNNDGAISSDELQLMFLVAGGEAAANAHPGVWAMQWYMDGSYSTDAPILDGVKIMDYDTGGNYAQFGEKYWDADTGDEATIGLIAHELGHAVFDLPDLYDTDSSDGRSEGIGNFGLMSSGSWGRQTGETGGATPVHMTGWSKMHSGFIEPVLIKTDTAALQIKATSQTEYKLYKIPTANADEYFLLENRDASGYDRGLYVMSPDSDSGPFYGGLSILHIDNTQSNNDDETHKLVDIEEANGHNMDIKGNRGQYQNLFFSGNSTQFTPQTTPDTDTYNNGQSGISITNISARGSTMSLDIDFN